MRRVRAEPADPSRPRAVDLLFVVVVPAAIVAAMYLAPFAADRSTLPFGVDTSAYIWRTNVVHDLGVSSLTTEATNARKPQGDRPGLPIVLSLLRSVTGLSSLSLAWFSPALLATALGLVVGSLAADGSLEARRRSGVVGVAVAGSAFVAWTAVGYAANLALDVVAVGAAVFVLEVRRGRSGVWAGAILLAAAVLLHWMFAVLFFAVLGVSAAARLVTSDGEEEARRAFRMHLTVLVVGAALGIAALILAPERPGSLPDVDTSRPGPVGRAELRIPAMALPLTLPIALLGSVLVFFDRRLDRRDAAVLLGVWSSLAVISVVGWYLLDLPLPPYRWAGFALAIPVSVVLCAFVIGDRLARPGGHLGLMGTVLGAAATIGLVGAGASVWWSREPTLDADEFGQLGTLSAYLEPLPVDTPVVILIGSGRRFAPISRAWAGLPAERLRYLRMVPAAIRPDEPAFGLDPDLLGDPRAVVVALDAYHRRPVDAGVPLGPGVHVLVGPRSEVEPGAIPRAPPAIGLAAGVAVLLAVLVLTGIGWAALTDLPALGVVSVAPALAVALLTCAGFVASRLGIPLHGWGGAGLVVGIAAVGWIAAIARSRRPVAIATIPNGVVERRQGSSSALGPSW
jgi:hypothetical protein